MNSKFQISYKVTGLQKILANLGSRKQLLLENLKQAVDDGSTIVEARAKEIVPVRSGNLMRSIHTQFKNDGFTAVIGPDYKAAPYAYYVEFGRSKSGKIPPYPFAGRHYMEQSFYQTKIQVTKILENAVKNAIR